MLLRNHDDNRHGRQLDIGWEAKGGDLWDALTSLKEYFWEDGLEDQDELLFKTIHQVLYRLWAHSYTSAINDPVPDPTERYLMLQSVGTNGAFMEPHSITPIIAKFKYVLRLTMIYELHNPTFIEKHDSVHALSAQIGQWIHEKCNDSTFNTLCSLTHRASAIAYMTMGMPRLYWPKYNDPSVMHYRGDELTLAGIRSMLHRTEDDLVRVFEDEVMMGLKFPIPRVHIADDLSNCDVGYSFVSDPRNTHLHQQTTLISTIMRTHRLREHYTYKDSEGTRRWKLKALQSWLGSYAEHSSTVLVRCETLSGSPSRGTELTGMQFRSTPTRGTRNLCVFGKHIVMLRTYSKVSSLTGRDRIIPHSLDAVTGDILLQDLVYARPFAEFVVSQLYPNNSTVRNLYHNYVFVKKDRLFDTPDLSTKLKHYTTKYTGVTLGVNAWRHVAIGLRRKVCPADSQFIDEGAEDTIGAEQAGHSWQTERRKYGISPDALAGQAEEIMPLFLNASTGWQRAMRTCPGRASFINTVRRMLTTRSGGLDLPYTSARHTQFDELVLSEVTSCETRAAEQTVNFNTVTDVIVNRITASLSVQIEDLKVYLSQQIMGTLVPRIQDVVQTTLAHQVPYIPKETP